MTAEIKLAGDIADLRKINKFYRQHGQYVSVNRNDEVVFYRSSERINAACMIRTLSLDNKEFLLLRSLFVEPRERKKGIGRSICLKLRASVDGDIYLVCAPNLITFYQSLGYEETNENELPKMMLQQIKKGQTLMVCPSN